MVNNANIAEIIEKVRATLSSRSGPTVPIDDYSCELVVMLTKEQEMHPQKIADALGLALGSVLRILSRRGVRAAGVKSQWQRKIGSSKTLDEFIFASVLRFKEQGGSSSEAARELGLKLKDVNAAWPFPSYESYMRLR